MKQTKFLGIIYLIFGLVLFIYGLLQILIPIGAFVIGLLLINQGLKFSNLPTFGYWAKYWFIKFR